MRKKTDTCVLVHNWCQIIATNEGHLDANKSKVCNTCLLSCHLPLAIVLPLATCHCLATCHLPLSCHLPLACLATCHLPCLGGSKSKTVLPLVTCLVLVPANLKCLTLAFMAWKGYISVGERFQKCKWKNYS